MKLKYYLRGLGIGIVVTALLMGFATRDKGNLTDEEIKERAALLGMVEQRVLADISTPAPDSEIEDSTPAPEITEEPVVTEAPTDTEVPDVTKEPESMEAEATPTPTVAPTATPTAAPTPAPTAEPTAAPTATPTGSTESYTLIIKSGETSWSISKALYEAGVIDSAEKFDTYLCQNGYDKTIRTGTFEIAKNATYEEIAKKIAR